jgi:hypothetical protein
VGRLVFLFFRRGGCQGNKLLIVFNLKQKKKLQKKLEGGRSDTHSYTHNHAHTHRERGGNSVEKVSDKKKIVFQIN